MFEKAIGYSLGIGRPGLRRKVSTTYAAQQGVVNTDVNGEKSDEAEEAAEAAPAAEEPLPDFATLTLDQIKEAFGEDVKGTKSALAKFLAAENDEQRRKVWLEAREKRAKAEAAKAAQEKKKGGKVSTEMLRLSKILFQSKEFDEIVKEDSRIRSSLRQLALPSTLRTGVYLVPLELIPKIDKLVEDYRQNRQALIDKLPPKYADIIASAKNQLGPLFEETDYPSVEEFMGEFYVTTGYLNFGVPDLLKKVSANLFDREKERLAKSVQNAEEEIRQVLRVGLKELLDHMVDRLQPGPDGKPKVFKNTLVSNLSDFLSTFDARNITDDAELKKVVDNIRGTLDGVDPTKLRSDEGLKNTISERIGEVKKVLDTMVAEKAGRKFDWE